MAWGQSGLELIWLTPRGRKANRHDWSFKTCVFGWFGIGSKYLAPMFELLIRRFFPPESEPYRPVKIFYDLIRVWRHFLKGQLHDIEFDSFGEGCGCIELCPDLVVRYQRSNGKPSVFCFFGLCQTLKFTRADTHTHTHSYKYDTLYKCPNAKICFHCSWLGTSSLKHENQKRKPRHWHTLG